jgi:curli biogenesis system outer membrane secretion channel CsgG
MWMRKTAWMLMMVFFMSVFSVRAASAGLLGIGKKDAGPQYTPGEKWEAYIQDDKGVTRALIQPVERNDDKDWMFLRFTDYKGPRNRLAVMKIENKTAQEEHAESEGSWFVPHAVEVPLAGLEELLTTALFNTHRFDLTERKVIQGALAEQDFGASGRVSAPTAAKVGKVLGADFLIFATVNEWTPVKSRIGGGGGLAGALGGGLGKVVSAVGAGKTTAEVAMSFRIVDATTGQVIYSETQRAQAGSWNLTLGGLAGTAGAGGLDRSSPIGYAVQSCINKVAYKIAMSLKEKGWTGTIAGIEGGKVFINAGSNQGMQVGMKLVALSKGQALIDPETEMSLGEDTEAIGSLQITAVKDKFSIATILQGCDGLKKGDRVEAADGTL